MRKTILIAAVIAAIVGWHVWVWTSMRYGSLRINPVSDVATLELPGPAAFGVTDPQEVAAFEGGRALAAVPIVENKLNLYARRYFDLYALALPYRVNIVNRVDEHLSPNAADEVMGEKIARAAEQVEKGNLGTLQARQLAAIESVLQQDEKEWLQGKFKPVYGCADSSTDCRRDFLNTISYRPVNLSPSGQPGLIVQADFFCGSHGCQLYVLKQSGNGYQNVLNEVGGLGSVTVASTTTNGFFDLIADTGTVAFPEQTRYMWDGSKYAKAK
jgi:hypothetical protein